MPDGILKTSDLKEYTAFFENGQTLFLEGDDSQDLYILISGQLDVLKGDNRIAEVTEPGDIFGEMSFLLGSSRTATVKARSEGEVIRIPRDEISTFLCKFPDLAKNITRLLARRLDETSQILFGLKEFCDQLPDAVILTNREGKILTWNAVAEKMYGRTWSEMHYKPAEDIYEDPEEYRNYLDEVQSKHSLPEKILTINHPEKGPRFISTSTTVLYDGHHNFQGILFLGRDVTSFKEMEKRYHRFRKRIIPSLIMVFLIAAGFFLLVPYFTNNTKMIPDSNRQRFQNQLGKDFLYMKSLLLGPLTERDRMKTSQLMKDFFDIQEPGEIPYHGLILLDENLTVFDAYSLTTRRKGAANMIGTSYSGIEFQGDENSNYRVLTLYRVDKDHPMGKKGVEIAFEINKKDQLVGWLIFQMDMKFLKSRYGMNEADLEKLHFNKS